MPTILITGANRGLGLEFARQYAEAGWQVIATCRRPDQAAALAALPVERLPLELGDAAGIAALARGLNGRAIDVLLNNAGVYGGEQSLGRLDAEDWLQVLRVNAVAPLLLAEALLPNVLAGQQKLLVFVTSVMGSIAGNESGGLYAYRSSKAALNAAVRSLSIDLAGKGATALLLHPGWVKTDMGGSGAPTQIPDSIRGMRQVIAAVKPGDPLRFVDFRGKALAW